MLLGGLPHQNPTQAVELSRRYAGALLTWPQLPRRGFRERLFVQSAARFPGLVADASRAQVYVDGNAARHELDRLALAYLDADIEYAALTSDDAAGLFELLRQNTAPKGTLALKGQLLGPISLAIQLTDSRQRPLIYDETLFEALTQYLCLYAAWQDARLAELSDVTIICLNEPFLEMVDLPFLPIDWECARDHLDEVLREITGCKALFAGGAVDWSRLVETSAELIVVDVFAHADAFVAAVPTIAGFIDRGGLIGLGCVPADEGALYGLTAATLLDRLSVLMTTLELVHLPADRLLPHVVITPNDVLSRLSVEAAERALQLVHEVSLLLRQQYQLA